MPTLELTDEQVTTLLQQLPDAQKRRVMGHLSHPAPQKPQPKFGSAKDDILAIADDFDAPLDDFKEYM